MRKLLFSSISLIALFLFIVDGAKAQTYGCTDPNANNFNPLATTNDGTCTYNVTLFNPKVKYLLPQEIDETSGLALYNSRLWTINDSGGLPILYAFDTVTGQVLQRITVLNATNKDWEALADDDEFIYIGDFGNNSGNRDDLAVYRVKKSEIPLQGHGSVNSEKITFTYSDYFGKIKKSRDNNYDCEAFIAKGEHLYLFSKNYGDQQSKLYQLAKEPGDYTASLITTFNTSGLITGADINTHSNEITLMGYVNQSWIPFTWLLFDFEGDNFFSGNKRRIDLPNMVATQTEAIVYTVGKNEIFTSEGHILYSQTAYEFNSGIWTNNSPSAIPEVSSNDFDFVLSPNPVKKNKLTIEVTRLPQGEYQFEIYDTLGRMIAINKYSMRRNDGNTKIKIKVGNYKPGLYFVRLSSGSQIVEKKFIKN